jgi:hypothetical protein
MSFSLQVPINAYIAAARSPSLSEPANKKIFPAQAYTTQRVLRDVVVDLERAVVAIQRQGAPLLQRVVDRLGRIGLRRQCFELCPEPRFVDLKQRFGFLLPYSQPFGNRPAANGGLDVVETTNIFEGPLCCVRRRAHVDVAELSPRVGMACSLAYRAIAEQFVEASEMLCITFRGLCCGQIYVAAMSSSEGLSNPP